MALRTYSYVYLAVPTSFSRGARRKHNKQGSKSKKYRSRKKGRAALTIDNVPDHRSWERKKIVVAKRWMVI